MRKPTKYWSARRVPTYPITRSSICVRLRATWRRSWLEAGRFTPLWRTIKPPTNRSSRIGTNSHASLSRPPGPIFDLFADVPNPTPERKHHASAVDRRSCTLELGVVEHFSCPLLDYRIQDTCWRAENRLLKEFLFEKVGCCGLGGL